jgi:hypothetical protein
MSDAITVIEWLDSRIGEEICRPMPTGTSPYIRRPERASWLEWRRVRLSDGTEREETRHVSRWGGSYSHDEWRAKAA